MHPDTDEESKKNGKKKTEREKTESETYRKSKVNKSNCKNENKTAFAPYILNSNNNKSITYMRTYEKNCTYFQYEIEYAWNVQFCDIRTQFNLLNQCSLQNVWIRRAQKRKYIALNRLDAIEYLRMNELVACPVSIDKSTFHLIAISIRHPFHSAHFRMHSLESMCRDSLHLRLHTSSARWIRLY